VTHRWRGSCRSLGRQCRSPLLAVMVSTSVACGGESKDALSQVEPARVQVAISEHIATVATVTWETDAKSVGYVEYGTSTELGALTPLEGESGLRHQRTLLGLTAETEYFFQVVSVADDGTKQRGEIQSFETDHLPGSLPGLSVSGDGHDQYTVVPMLGATSAVTILNPQGEIVWYHMDDRQLDFYRARLSQDGEHLIYNAASISGDPAEDSELVWVALDGSASRSVRVPLLAHDFVEHRDGTIGAMVVEFREFEGQELRGDAIVEVDADGNIEPVWNSWDCFDPAEVMSDEITGWTFGNALDYDPEEDAYYLGMRNFSSITKIDRQSGECEWVLGLYGATLKFEAGADRFLHQHQFEVHGNRILVMDNDGSIEDESRVLEYELDLERNRDRQVWSYVSDPSVYTFVLGEPTRIDDDIFINWSAAGQLERINGRDERIWQVNTPPGTVFGFHTLASDLYSPTAPRP
jgi:hypothetical protein